MREGKEEREYKTVYKGEHDLLGGNKSYRKKKNVEQTGVWVVLGVDRVGEV